MSAIGDAVAAAEASLSVDVVSSAADLEEVYRLRHQVYCVEHAYEPGQDGLEHDVCDEHSRHVLLRSRADGEVLGTARLVMTGPGQRMPIQALVEPGLLGHLPRESTAEISRFAVSKSRRLGIPAEVGPMMRLSLIRGLFDLSSQVGVTHWAAVMEPSLLRLLRSTGIHFQAIGPVVDYHGKRQPCANPVATIAAALRQEQPLLWEYLTDKGRFVTPGRICNAVQTDAAPA